MLLHERFNDNDANGLFREALENNPASAEAYTALATVSADGVEGQAAEYLAKAIALDPKLAEAHELMADSALSNDDTDVAAAEADKAIASSASFSSAMALSASAAAT